MSSAPPGVPPLSLQTDAADAPRPPVDDRPHFLQTFRRRERALRTAADRLAAYGGADFMRKRGKTVRPKALTPAQVKEAREWFDLLDTDGNGDLDVDEITTALRAISLDVSRKDVVAMLEQVELTKTQSLAFSDFLIMISAAVNESRSSALTSALGANGKTFAEAARAAQRRQFLDKVLRGGLARKRAINERIAQMNDTPALARAVSATFDSAKRNAIMELHRYHSDKALTESEIAAFDDKDVPPKVVLQELAEIWKERRKEADAFVPEDDKDSSVDEEYDAQNDSAGESPCPTASTDLEPKQASLLPSMRRRSVFLKRRELSQLTAEPIFDSDSVDRRLRRKLPSLDTYREGITGTISGSATREWSARAMAERELQAKRRFETLIAAANSHRSPRAGARSYRSEFITQDNDGSRWGRRGPRNVPLSPRQATAQSSRYRVMSPIDSPQLVRSGDPVYALISPRPPHAVPHPSARHILQHTSQARHLGGGLQGGSSKSGPLVV